MLIETKLSPMPTCADFGFIDQYLNLKEQMEITGTYDLVDLDQKVPQTEYSASFPPKSAIKVEDSSAGLYDAYFEDLGRPYMYSTNHFTSTSTTPPILSAQMPEQIFSGSGSLTTLTSLNSSSSLNSSDHSNGSSTTDAAPCTYVARVAGSGCTVIQGGADPQLCDLDKPRAILDDCIKKYIKTEPSEDLQLPQTCHMGALATSGIGLHNNYESTMETVLDQLFRNDVQSDCKMLAISPDPMMWSLDDVQRWVRWTCRKYNYRDDCWSLFNVTGEIMCRMSEDDFRWRAPEAGNCLYHQLEAWKLACKSFPEPPVSSYPSPPYGESEHPFPPASRFQGQPDPSVSPSPSVSSTCSTASCSSSSNSFHQNDTNDDDVFTHAAGNGIRRQSAPQIPFQPSAGNRPHSHPAGQRQPKQTIHLWQFLKELLEDPDNYHGCIKWTDRSRGIFKIEDSSRVARLWGRRKNRPAMNYDKLSRSVRQYYKKGIIKKTEHSKRLVYQFCPPYL